MLKRNADQIREWQQRSRRHYFRNNRRSGSYDVFGLGDWGYETMKFIIRISNGEMLGGYARTVSDAVHGELVRRGIKEGQRVRVVADRKTYDTVVEVSVGEGEGL